MRVMLSDVSRATFVYYSRPAKWVLELSLAFNDSRGLALFWHTRHLKTKEIVSTPIPFCSSPFKASFAQVPCTLLALECVVFDLPSLLFFPARFSPPF